MSGWPWSWPSIRTTPPRAVTGMQQQAAPALGPRVWFCRSTMLGLVRLLTQPKLMGDGVLGLTDAHAIYQQLRQTEGVGFAGDAESADALLARWVTATAAARAPVDRRLARRQRRSRRPAAGELRRRFRPLPADPPPAPGRRGAVGSGDLTPPHGPDPPDGPPRPDRPQHRRALARPAGPAAQRHRVRPGASSSRWRCPAASTPWWSRPCCARARRPSRWPQALGLAPRLDADFRERDFGIFEGLTADDAAQQFPELAARNVAYRWDEAPPPAPRPRASWWSGLRAGCSACARPTTARPCCWSRTASWCAAFAT